jgi:hypothetical protein
MATREPGRAVGKGDSGVRVAVGLGFGFGFGFGFVSG